MANLLAIYGGVAADSTILNFKSLNVLWNHMQQQRADAVVYWYRSLVSPSHRSMALVVDPPTALFSGWYTICTDKAGSTGLMGAM